MEGGKENEGGGGGGMRGVDRGEEEGMEKQNGREVVVRARGGTVR